MKKLIYLNCLVSLCLATSLSAQKVIELSKSRLDVGKRRFNITQVVDVRYDTTRLGIARLGLENRKEPIILSEPLDKAVQKYFSSKLPAQPDLPNIILRVSRLGLWEEITSTGTEGARVAVDFEFFLQKEDRYAFIGDRKFRYTEGLGSNVTKYHDDNLRAALQSALDYLQDSVDWKTVDALPADATLESFSQRITPRILTDSIPVTGAYKNFTDFRNNSPRVAARIDVEDGSNVLLIEGRKGKFRRVNANDKIWGFSDGKNLYINQFGTFYKLEKSPASTFQFFGVDYDKKLTNAAIGASAFGIIGGLLAGEMTKSRHYVVDWETGSFLRKE